MNRSDIKYEVRELCSRQKSGDPHAASECEQQFGAAVRCIVRRVTRTGRASSRLELFILAEAKKVRQLLIDNSATDRDTVATLVSNRICHSLLVRMNPEPSRMSRFLTTTRKHMRTLTPDCFSR